jgi:hypothetical protein
MDACSSKPGEQEKVWQIFLYAQTLLGHFAIIEKRAAMDHASHLA